MPLFADGIDIAGNQPLASEGGTVICNFAFQQYLMRGLTGLSDYTGDPKYRTAAGEATAYVLEHLVNEKSGLIHWGGHAFWDLRKDGPAFSPHDSHELKCVFPFYELFYEVDPERTKRYIEAVWKAHVDLSDESFLFGRHAKMNADISRPRRIRPGELAFSNTGADLIYAAAFLHQKTRDRMWLSRAVGLAESIHALNDPRTGLSPEILDVLRDPDFCRRVDSEQLRVERSREHTGRLGGRARQFALAQLAASQMLTDESARRLVDWTVADLLAYARHGYDDGERGAASGGRQPADKSGGSRPRLAEFFTRSERGFYGMLRTETGKRIRFSEVEWSPGFYFPPCKFQKNLGLPILFHAYARAYRLRNHDGLLQTAKTCLDLLGMKPGTSRVDLTGIPEGMRNSDMAAQLIQGLLELHEATRDPWYQNAARQIADQSLRLFFDGDYFVAWPGEFRQSPVNLAIPLALLRLAAALERKSVDLPVDPGGLGMEPNWNYCISYIDGDFDLRWQWGKHFTDLHAPDAAIKCRIGDRSPHVPAGGWDHAGIWRLGGTWSDQENVLDDQRGIVFEPLCDLIPREMTKLDDGDLQVKHWSYGRGDPPHLGVRSRYQLKSSHFLDWTLEVTPLEAGYGDLDLDATVFLASGASPKDRNLVAKDGGSIHYSRIGDSFLAFLFQPDAPVEFQVEGPTDDYPGGLRRIRWYVRDVQKGQFYQLRVRIGLVPASTRDFEKMLGVILEGVRRTSAVDPEARP
jgi:pectate lyase